MADATGVTRRVMAVDRAGTGVGAAGLGGVHGVPLPRRCRGIGVRRRREFI
jgi:hypothetical protein